MTLASNDHDDLDMTISMLADTIHSIELRKQKPEKLDDVIDIIEYLRDQALTLHRENVEATERLNARAAALTKREAELQIKQRAVESILKTRTRRSPFARLLGR